MPVEFSRTTARKRITLPSGGQVDVRVITSISFKDASDRYQEIQYTIDNSAASNRIVHVDQVQGTDGTTLPVERIDTWNVLDPEDRHQETQMTLDNVTGADSTPPHFSSHFRTHVYRFTNNSGEWIDSELIDELVIVDPNDRHQETHYFLNNPAADDPAGQADPADPDISDTANGIDSPWRTDPFQNIVNFHKAAGIAVQWAFLRTDHDNGTIIDLATWSIISRSVSGGGTSTVVITTDPTVNPQSFAPSGSFALLGEEPVQTTSASLGIAIYGIPYPGGGNPIPTGDVATFDASGAAITVDGVPWVLSSTFITSFLTVNPPQSMGNQVNVSASFVPP